MAIYTILVPPGTSDSPLISPSFSYRDNVTAPTGVPTSEVGYTSASAGGGGDHEV